MNLNFHSSLPHWRGSIILVVTALKTFRSAFSDCSKQYLVLMLTILLFQYEPSTGFINGGVEATDGSKVLLCIFKSHFVKKIKNNNLTR